MHQGGVTGATADAGARGADGRGAHSGVDAGDGAEDAGAGMPSAEGQAGGARASTQRWGRKVGATESKGEGKQTPPLAFGAREGFGGMRKKKERPPARV